MTNANAVTSHTASVREVHVIYPRDRTEYEATCPCGYRSSTFAKRKEAEAWGAIHCDTEAARVAAEGVVLP